MRDFAGGVVVHMVRVVPTRLGRNHHNRFGIRFALLLTGMNLFVWSPVTDIYAYVDIFLCVTADALAFPKPRIGEFFFAN